MTHDYVRNGTTSLFAAMDVASGPVIAQHYRRHRRQEFLRFLKLIDAAVPGGLDLHLVCDNYATHKTPEVKKWLLRHPRFHLHFTPTSSSWMNLVERWFAELTNRKLRRSAHRSVTELEADIRTWINESNRTRSRSCGPRPPTRSWTPSPPTADESTTQDTTRSSPGEPLIKSPAGAPTWWTSSMRQPTPSPGPRPRPSVTLPSVEAVLTARRNRGGTGHSAHDSAPAQRP